MNWRMFCSILSELKDRIEAASRCHKLVMMALLLERQSLSQMYLLMAQTFNILKHTDGLNLT